MPKATAVWLVENTTLTFKQIAEFCKLHEVEVQGIADGEVGRNADAVVADDLQEMLVSVGGEFNVDSALPAVGEGVF